MTINLTTKGMLELIKIALLLAIFILLLWTKPWDSTSDSQARTITVSGEATISAEPDEFRFSPYLEEQGLDQDELKSTITTKATDMVDGLKELGVEEKNITLDVSSFDSWYWEQGEEGVLSAYITVSLPSDELAQEVQDYLLTTDAKGQLTPQASFSTEKRGELDTQAIEQASNDAREKAEAQAKLFDAKLGKVVTLSQGGNNFSGYPEEVYSTDVAIESREASLPVLAGEQEYRQYVTVVYELQ